MRILNTSYQKRKIYLETYSSGGREAQTGYMLLRKDHANECRKCKSATHHTTQNHNMVVKKARQRRAENSMKEMNK